MALKDCSSAERLVVADRFALFLDRLAAGDPGLERQLALIERGGEDAPTPDQLDAFLALVQTDIDQPTIEELELMFPKASDGEAKPAQPARRGMSIGEALRTLRRLQAQGAVSVNVNKRYLNLWRRSEEDGRLSPTPIARIARDDLKRVLAR